MGQNPLEDVCTYSSICQSGLAIAHGSDDAATALLSAGADPNIADKQGRTALHHLAEQAEMMNPVLLPYLIEADADFSMRDKANRLPIEVAYQQISKGAPVKDR